MTQNPELKYDRTNPISAGDLLAARWQRVVNYFNQKEGVEAIDLNVWKDAQRFVVYPILRLFGSATAEAGLAEDRSHRIEALVDILSKKYTFNPKLFFGKSGSDIFSGTDWVRGIELSYSEIEAPKDINLWDSVYQSWGKIDGVKLAKDGSNGFSGINKTVVELAETAAKLEAVVKYINTVPAYQGLPLHRVKQVQEVAQVAARLVIDGVIKPEIRNGYFPAERALAIADQEILKGKFRKTFGTLFVLIFSSCAVAAPPSTPDVHIENPVDVLPTATAIKSPNMDHAPRLIDSNTPVPIDVPTNVPRAIVDPEFGYSVVGLTGNSTFETISASLDSVKIDSTTEWAKDWIKSEIIPIVKTVDAQVPECDSVNIVGDTSNWEPVCMNADKQVLWAQNIATGLWETKAVVFNKDKTVNTTDYKYLPISTNTDVQIYMSGDVMVVTDVIVQVDDHDGVSTDTQLKLFITDESGVRKWIWNEIGVQAFATIEGYDINNSSFDIETGVLTLSDGKKYQYKEGKLEEVVKPTLTLAEWGNMTPEERMASIPATSELGTDPTFLGDNPVAYYFNLEGILVDGVNALTGEPMGEQQVFEDLLKLNGVTQENAFRDDSNVREITMISTRGFLGIPINSGFDNFEYIDVFLNGVKYTLEGKTYITKDPKDGRVIKLFGSNGVMNTNGVYLYHPEYDWLKTKFGVAYEVNFMKEARGDLLEHPGTIVFRTISHNGVPFDDMLNDQPYHRDFLWPVDLGVGIQLIRENDGEW